MTSARLHSVGVYRPGSMARKWVQTKPPARARGAGLTTFWDPGLMWQWGKVAGEVFAELLQPDTSPGTAGTADTPLAAQIQRV